MSIDASTRLPGSFDESNLIDLVQACIDEIAVTTAILEYARDNLTIDSAEGVWLDEIGEIVGAPRASEQRDDDTVFAYCALADYPGTVSKGLSDSETLLGGHYNSVRGLPTGVLISDTDFRTLIRAKVKSTYSGDSIPDMWQWIYDVFGITATFTETNPAEVIIDLDSYLSHYNRRILKQYIPRAAGVQIWLRHWPAEGSLFSVLGTSESITLDSSTPGLVVAAASSGEAEGSAESEGVYTSLTLDDESAGILTVTGEGAGIEINLGNAAQYPAFHPQRIRNTVDYVVPVYLYSGELLCNLYPNSEVSLILLDPSYGAYESGYDGLWHVLGIGVGFASLFELDLRGAAAIETEECAAAGFVTGEIDTFASRGNCLFLQITSTSDDSRIQFYSDALMTSEVYDYANADCTGPFVDPINWQINISDGLLTNGKLYYKITNNDSSAATYSIEMVIHGASDTTTTQEITSATAGVVRTLAIVATYADATSSHTMHLPTGTVITSVQIAPSIAFNGAAPTVLVEAVGAASVTIADPTSAQIKQTDNVITFQQQTVLESLSTITATVDADGSTAGSVAILVSYTVPQ